MSRRGILASSFALVTIAAAAAAIPAAVAERAAATPKTETLAKGLVGPLSMAVSKDGTVYVAQNFAGLLMRMAPGGTPEVVYAAKKGTEVGAVSEHRGSLRFATTAGAKTSLWRVAAGGRPVKMASLSRFERRQNPDAAVSYGFEGGLDPACAAQVPAEVPASYTGIVESHPYATAIKGRTTYVADAAGNDILSVSARGRVRSLAVLPPVPVLVTAEMAAGSGLPVCTVGRTYLFEPVPTDVEVRGGQLFVSTLTGGPEDGSTGAQSRVYRVSRSTGAVTLVAGGLSSAVGLGVAKNGDIYVSQLFTGQISRIRAGSAVAMPWITTTMPAAIEWTPDGLYATTHALPPEKGRPNGKVVRIH